jgi:hypothetical protein
MIKVVAAFFLLLGSGLIFHALVAMDAPNLGPKRLARRPLPQRRSRNGQADLPLRRAA